jgi:erythromycin esterase-like protein
MSTGPLTQEQIIKLAHAYHNDDLHGSLERVVQAAARLGMELAAQVCDELDRTGIPAYGGYTNLANADDCAAAIRERARE